MTPEELAAIRGRLVAHEVMIMAIGIELGLTQDKKADVLATASELLEALPIAPSVDAAAAFREAQRYLSIMTGVIMNTEAFSDD